MAMAQAPLTPWSADKVHSDRERWICIYPAFLNRKKTRQEGRRIPRDGCVDNPTFQEIRDVLQAAQLNVLVENKLYSRERSKESTNRGRIRVQLKHDDGTLVNAEFPSRDSVLLYAGKTIPMLKTRQMKPAEAAPVAAASSSSAGGQKKGKGKRR